MAGVFVAVRGFPLVGSSRGYPVAVCRLLCGSFSCGAQARSTWASIIAAHGLSSCGSQALECWLSSCGT